MTISELMGDLMPKKKHVMPELICKDPLCRRETSRVARNETINEISAIEIPEERLMEMGYVKKEV